MTDASGDPDAGPESPRCVACLEAIRPGARVCPHCHSPQRHDRWRSLGTALKWLGGITATLSLVLGAVQVSELLESWRDRRESVDELVRAARLQMEARDYSGAWRLIEEALVLEPGSPSARELGAEVAMDWLRNVRVRSTEGESFSDVVEQIAPMLYRRAARGEGEAAADALAHIGWASYLRAREGVAGLDVEGQYERAIELDPDNVYAHAMWAYWLLWGGYYGDHAGRELEQARVHFERALESGRDRAYARRLSLAAALNGGAEARLEALRIAAAMRGQGERPPASYPGRLLNLYREIGYGPAQSEKAVAQLTAALPAAELLELLHWLERDLVGRDHPLPAVRRSFIIARLTEEIGEIERAHELYTSLEGGDAYWLPPALSAALDRIEAQLEGAAGAEQD